MSKPIPFLVRRKYVVLAAILLVALAELQFFSPKIKNPPVVADFDPPAQVKAILKRACYDCHSNETNLRWYDKVAPFSWTVAGHVKQGRQGLNFSNWQKMAPADQGGKLWESINQIAAGAMPIKDYVLVHPAAKVSVADLAVLKAYALSLVVNKPSDTSAINAAGIQYEEWKHQKPNLANLPVALNGIAFMPEYKNWQPISTTERFDNNTLRVILGNDIAIAAIKENKVSPWPNGTIFAKVAWEQLQDDDGNVRPGLFKQVEYMIKDSKKYASTRGWGFARFKTPKMVPYGKNALFATECVNCHQPMSGQDFVFTQPIKQ